MKFLVVLAVAVACASAVKDEYNAPIVRSVYDLTPEGAYQYAYETGNGISAEAQGVLSKSEYPSLEVSGGYRYSSPEGEPIQVTYVANEFGYQPEEYPSLEVSGGYRYSSPEGEPIQVTYVANEFGYQPEGSHLPVPPPTPEAILRSLAYIAAHPPPAEGIQKPVGPPKPAYG